MEFFEIGCDLKIHFNMTPFKPKQTTIATTMKGTCLTVMCSAFMSQLSVMDISVIICLLGLEKLEFHPTMYEKQMVQSKKETLI